MISEDNRIMAYLCNLKILFLIIYYINNFGSQHFRSFLTRNIIDNKLLTNFHQVKFMKFKITLHH